MLSFLKLFALVTFFETDDIIDSHANGCFSNMQATGKEYRNLKRPYIR